MAIGGNHVHIINKLVDYKHFFVALVFEFKKQKKKKIIWKGRQRKRKEKGKKRRIENRE